MIKIEVLDKNYVFEGENFKGDDEAFSTEGLFETYLKKLKDEDGYSELGVENIRESCESIHNFIESDKIKSGLLTNIGIVGNVQSGKTSSIIGNCCALIDNGGYINVIVVLSGTSGPKTSLYRQTHDRFASVFKINNGYKYKYALIPNSDINTGNELIRKYSKSKTEITGIIDSGKNIVYIVMKEIQHLKTLKAEIDKISSIISNSVDRKSTKYRIIVFDDECDDSSIETSKGKIPELIYDILSFNNFNERLYVGYTATPAAKQLENVQNKLKIDKYFTLRYPTILDVNPLLNYKVETLKESYTGSDYYYKNEFKLIKSYENEDQHELKNSLSVYIVGSFLFRVLFPDKKAQMLIHESSSITEHSSIEKHLNKLLKMNRKDFSYTFNDTEMTAIYNEYISSIINFESDLFANLIKYNENFQTLYSGSFEAIYEIYNDIELLLLNSENKYVLGGSGGHTINIGGNIMSRGVTFNNLITSVFLREPSSEDTLSQMQRWFGYRGSYLPLCRVITTKQILNKLLNINKNYIKNIVNLNDETMQNMVPIEKRSDRPTGKISSNGLKVQRGSSDIFIKLDNIYGIKLHELLEGYKSVLMLSDLDKVLDKLIHYSELDKLRQTIKSYLKDNYDLELYYRVIESKSENISTWGTHKQDGAIANDRFLMNPNSENNKVNGLLVIYLNNKQPLLLAFRKGLTAKNSLFVVNNERAGAK